MVPGGHAFWRVSGAAGLSRHCDTMNATDLTKQISVGRLIEVSSLANCFDIFKTDPSAPVLGGSPANYVTLHKLPTKRHMFRRPRFSSHKTKAL